MSAGLQDQEGYRRAEEDFKRLPKYKAAVVRQSMHHKCGQEFFTSFTLSRYSAWQCHMFTRAQFPGLGVDNR